VLTEIAEGWAPASPPTSPNPEVQPSGVAPEVRNPLKSAWGVPWQNRTLIGLFGDPYLADTNLEGGMLVIKGGGVAVARDLASALDRPHRADGDGPGSRL
jgi:hypothetical protein